MYGEPEPPRDESIVVDAPSPGREPAGGAAGPEPRLEAPDTPSDPDAPHGAAQRRFDAPPRPAPRFDRRPGPAGFDRRPPYQPGRPPMRGGQRYVPAPRPMNIQDPSLALRDDEELVAGRRPVEEAFVARREARRLLVVPQRRMALEKLVLHATSLRIPVVEVEGGTLTAIAGFDGHQGIALVVEPRRFASPDEILALALERAEPPLVLVLDSLEDPQNVGTLLRSAEATGVHGAVFPTVRQAPISPAAIKASAGATEHLRLAPVDDLAGALADLHIRGLRIVGADGDAALTAREADLRGPIAIVVGSEGRGLGPAVRRRCDLLVRIPMHGHIESLNAAVAGSILLYEAAAQRRLAESPHRERVHDELDADAEAGSGPDVAPAAAPKAEVEPAEGGESEPAAEPEPLAAAEPETLPVPEPVAESDPATAAKRAPRSVKARHARAGAKREAKDQEATAAEPAAEAPAVMKRPTKASKAAAHPPAGPTPSPDPALDEDALLPGGPSVSSPADAPADSPEV
jgi:23S rRNA (guanosine2251-2'-O)-methyltransferase